MSKKNFFIRITGFTVLFCLIFFFLEYLFFDSRAVSSTWQDLQDPQTTAPDILFMGNSHLFASLDVELISKATGLKTEILGSSAQNMEITLANLKVLLKQKKPKNIVLEINTALSDNREYLLSEKRGYLLENYDGIRNYWEKSKIAAAQFPLDSFPEMMFQLCRPTYSWARLMVPFHRDAYSKHNDILGYLSQTGYKDVAYETDHADKMKEAYLSASPLPIAKYNETALCKFLEITDAEQIPVFLYKSEAAHVNKETPGYITYIEQIAKEYDNVIILGDFNLYADEIGINNYDFRDNGHVNRKGAVKTALYMLKMLEEEGVCHSDLSSVFHYKGESVTLLDNGEYRYAAENFDPDTRYCFTVQENDRILVQKDYSDENYIDLPYLLSKSQLLTVRMIPQNCDAGNYSDTVEKGIGIRIMKELTSGECTIFSP